MSASALTRTPRLVVRCPGRRKGGGDASPASLKAALKFFQRQGGGHFRGAILLAFPQVLSNLVYRGKLRRSGHSSKFFLGH